MSLPISLADTTVHSHHGHSECHYSWTSDPATTTTIANVIGDYVSPVIIATGLVGNALSLCVMLQPRNRATSFGIYLAALAVCDSGGLVTWLCRTFVMAYWRRGLDDFGCKIDIGFKYAFRMAGYLLIVCLTADRFVAVRHPLRALQWCRARRAAYLSIAILAVSLLIALPVFTKFKRNHHRLYACVMFSDNSPLAAAYMIVVSLGGNLGPFAVILTMNSMIIWTIRRRLKYRGVCGRHLSLGYYRRPISSGSYAESEQAKPLSNTTAASTPSKVTLSVTQTSGSVRSARTKSFSCGDCAQTMLPLSRRDRNLINILMLITATFLLLNSPQLIRVAVSYFYHMDHMCSARSSQYLLFQVTNNLCNVNYSVNFFLYCMSGTRFRRDLMKMLKSAYIDVKRLYHNTF